MYYIKNLWSKLRYSSPLRLLTDILGRLGIRLTPYLIYKESLALADKGNFKPGEFSDYEVRELGPKDMENIAAIPRGIPEEEFQNKLRNGCRCFGITHQGQLAAFTWAKFDKVTFSEKSVRNLAEHEAYLFDAFTLMNFRGHGIAPFMRYQCYQQLAKMNVTNCYSVSLYFNTPANKFKRKLNAKKLELRLYCDFFKRHEINIPLKHYKGE